jgi:hypothetical protein
LAGAFGRRSHDRTRVENQEDELLAKHEWTEDDVAAVVVNPFYAVNFEANLCLEHPTLVSKEEWVRANLRLMEELGTERWLYRLLEILETGGPSNPEEGGDGPAGFGPLPSRQQRRLQQRRQAKRAST